MEKLKLLYPVKPFGLNQPFGGNLPCVEDTQNIPLPQRKIVTGSDNNTCPVGYVKLYPLLGLPKGHNGADLTAGEQPIYASHDGIVTETQLEAARGLGVGINTKDRVDMGSFGIHYARTRYWHFKEVKVQVGQEITEGDLIGISDTTGYSSGDHVHWELKPQDKDQNGEWVNTYQDNGFFGSIDPLPFCSGEYAEDVAQEISLLQKLVQLYKQLINALSAH